MIVACDPDGIKLAAITVKKGGLVVFPTDTVYGIGCDPRNPKAVDAIYSIKKRSQSKNLPVLGYSKEEISKIAIFDKLSNKIADRFWPGPVTLVLKLKDKEISESMKLDDKIAVRVPNHTCILSLLKECRIMVGTSANHSGNPSFSNSKEVLENFSGFDVFLDGGRILNSSESTIVEIVEGNLKILRPGKITKTELTALL
ncbi:MAG TPA: L-threonylcarbamoyladenylate synthase [Nitrosopumilaceae archaeon]|nr:L-threonylcarbamoyladenylate synthase [Nitrosopumilaceae archaeon]